MPKHIGAGDLRHPITIQIVTQTADTFGGAGTESWSTYCKAYALMEPVTGRELLLSQRPEAQLMVRFTIRYTSGLMYGSVLSEVPTGTKNGTNKTFTLAYAPTTGDHMVFLRGQKLKENSDFGYAISSTTLTIGSGVDAPASTDNFEIFYYSVGATDIRPKMRVLCYESYYDIESVQDIGGLRKWMELITVKRDS